MTKRLSSVLLVDDDSDMNMIMTYLFKKENFAEKVTIVCNGEEALAYLKNNPPPDLILLDTNMPRMNGWEFLKEYDKLDPKIRQPIRIVMVSASLNPGDKELIKQHGIGSIEKPVTADALKKVITAYWGD